MTVIQIQNAMGHPVAPPIGLPHQRRRLSAIVARRVPAAYRPGARPAIVAVARRGHPPVVTAATVRMRADWARTLVGPHDVVIITVLPLGGGGGGGGAKQIGTALAAIALTAIAGPIGTAIGGALFTAGSVAAGVTASLVSAGIVIGGQFLLSGASRAKANKQTEVYGVSGGGVLPRAGGRVPVIYGHQWHEPDLSQPDYIVYSGNQQTLYKRMTLGCGRYQIQTIRVGDTVMWTAAGGLSTAFAGAEIEIIEPGAVSVLVPSTVISSGQVASNTLPRPGDAQTHAGPFVLGSPDQTYTQIQIDWSSGPVHATNSAGKIKRAAISGLWERALVDAGGTVIGPWETLHQFSENLATREPVRRTVIETVPAGRYAVRARNLLPTPSGNAQNAIQWDGLRAPMADLATRPGITELAMRITAGPELGVTAFSDIQVEMTRILPVWTGSAWVEEPTRKAAWAFCDVLRNADYGAALGDARVDVARAAALAAGLNEFDTADVVIRGPVSVWEALTTVLIGLRAQPNYSGTQWSFTRDEPSAVRRYLFTARQMARGSARLTSIVAPDDGAADVIVSYRVDGDPKRPSEARHTIGSTSLTPSRVDLPSVTDPRHARHVATWMAAAAAYRRQQVSFETELDGRLLAPGMTIGVEMWFEGSQQVGVETVSGTGGRTLTLTGDVTLGAGDYVMLRDRRGRSWGPVAATRTAARVIVLDADDVATVASATGQALADVLATAGDAPSLVIRPGATVARDWLVEAVEPSGRDRVAVRAVLSPAAVWTALGETIAPVPNVPTPPTVPTQPQLAWLRAESRQHTASLEVAWQVSPMPGLRAVEVQLSYDDGDTWGVIARGPDTEGVAPLRLSDDAVMLRARAYGAAQAPSAWVTTTIVTGDVAIPGDIIPPSVIDLSKLAPDLSELLAGTDPGSLPWAEDQIGVINRELTDVVRESDRRFEFDLETLAQTIATLQSRFEELRSATIDAGLEINSIEGRARISAIAVLASDTARQFNDVAIELSSLDARISAIASVVIDGDLDGLIDDITTVGLELDALAASLSLYATTADLTTQVARINQAELDIDANTAEIALKAAQTVVDALSTRLNTAEIQISAQSGILQQVSAQTGATDIDIINRTLSDIIALLSQEQNARTEAVGRAESGLSSRITDQGEVISQQRLELLAANASTLAALTAEETARATADTALSQSITSVTANLNAATANGQFSVSAAAAPSGVASRVALSARAANGSWSAAASIFIDAIALNNGTYDSQVVINANKFFFTSGSGSPIQVFSADANVVKIVTRLEVGLDSKIVLDGSGPVSVFGIKR